MSSLNVSEFVVSFCNKESNKITDRVDIPNLLMLDTYDLLAIILRKKCNLFIQFEENNNKNYIDSLYLRIEATNSILRSLGNMNYLLVTKLKSNTTEEIVREELPLYSENFNENVVNILVKLGILKTSIKLSCEDLPLNQIQTQEPTVFFNKDIEQTKCTNCADCITYCPTQAFYHSENKDSILFISGKCIGCNLCEDVCQENAIINNTNINLIEFAFDVETQKIAFQNLNT